jgi:hypothetical protein
MRSRAGRADEGRAARSFLNEIRPLMSRSHHDSLELAAGPPPEVLLEIEAAWERAQVLVESGLEIHFDADHVRHRALASSRLADGTRRRLSALEAVLAACGDALIGPEVALTV